MKSIYYNPVEEVIEKLKEKELIMTKGANMQPLVKLEDAIQALEDLEIKLWACCESEILLKQVLNNKENY